MKQLLLGCGHRRDKLLGLNGKQDWDQVVRLDINPDCDPDVIWNLESPRPLPFGDSEFDEIHAYEVFEHIGSQGDHIAFLHSFSDYWRVLKPNGHIFATVPKWDSIQAWSDPSHRRVITIVTLAFLSQAEYEKQCGRTFMTDFRNIYCADFDQIFAENHGESFCFCLKCIKPSRWKPLAERRDNVQSEKLDGSRNP